MVHDLVLHGARLLTGDAPYPGTADGWVSVRSGRVAALGHGTPPDGRDRVDLAGDWLAPGYVDVHVHGGAGGDVMSPDPSARAAVRRLHARHGTTAMLASTVSRPADELREAVSRLAGDAAQEPGEDAEPIARLVGIHLEGPFLSRVRRGAHQETALRPPDQAEVEALLAAGRGQVRTITIAPELPGAIDLVGRLSAAGVTVAVGHTDADAGTVRAAVEAGARAVTHTFNGMQPLHHRRPGPVGMAMDLAQLTCELILDLVHVDPVAARALVHAAGADRICLVTDAMPATGVSDGTYELGGQVVEVVDGQARVSGTSTLAGSTLTMAVAVENAVSQLRVDVPTAVAMATVVPARLLPGVDVGRLHADGPADLVRLDGDARLRDVWISGQQVDRTPKEVTAS
ncbi:MAG TPA: N-acetylglucosamine-6-phosphate deacetylase [Nocardioides sp.]|uniref:N-acetylglucosamine-6-phosphate deacetylase n=1 Tax=Nocardioides sp. TaxID=35761 RepID=UPI002E37C4B7|nr:N-acetylglucosamine-6-phosphate deacetylase [Nocardioides sp.]HEX3932124.1 N-acetylglucosamine-6-phosphate deacetylase [Nocardioides sp.]